MLSWGTASAPGWLVLSKAQSLKWPLINQQSWWPTLSLGAPLPGGLKSLPTREPVGVVGDLFWKVHPVRRKRIGNLF